MYPKLKSLHPVCRISDRALRIGAEPGVTKEIPDAKGQIEAFLGLLDGTRTCDEIAVQMGISLSDVQKAIATLDAQGFLEEGKTTTSTLTPDELARYDANIHFFSHFGSLQKSKYTYQERLKRAHVLLIGVGGGGAHILSHLVGAGVGQITIVDYDKVELSNLNRQLLYTTTDVGRFKVQAAAERAMQINPHVQVTPVIKKIDGPEDVAVYAAGVDVIILAADEPVFGIQRWVNQVAIAFKIPMVMGFSQIQRGRCLTVNPAADTCCTDCLIINAIAEDPTYESFQRALIERGTRFPTAMLVPHAAIVAGLISAETLKLIAGHAPLATAGKMTEFHYLNFETGVATACEKLAECPTCGNGRLEDHPFLAYLEQKWPRT